MEARDENEWEPGLCLDGECDLSRDQAATVDDFFSFGGPITILPYFRGKA